MQSRPREIRFVTTYTDKRRRDREKISSDMARCSEYYVSKAKDKNKMASG